MGSVCSGRWRDRGGDTSQKDRLQRRELAARGWSRLEQPGVPSARAGRWGPAGCGRADKSVDGLPAAPDACAAVPSRAAHDPRGAGPWPHRSVRRESGGSMQTTLAMITSVLGWEGSPQAHAAAPAGPVQRARGSCWARGAAGLCHASACPPQEVTGCLPRRLMRRLSGQVFFFILVCGTSRAITCDRQPQVAAVPTQLADQRHLFLQAA